MNRPTGHQAFPQTRWSLVVNAGDDQSREELCQMYWRPVYAFLRQAGHAPGDAEDLTQGFFLRILKPGGIETAEQSKGKMRSFLLGALKRHLSSEKRYDHAAKRGGGQSDLPLATSEIDFKDAEYDYAAQPVEESSPDQLFDRSWAYNLLANAHRRLAENYEESGKLKEYELMKSAITTASDELNTSAVAEELKVAPATVRVLAHRLRSNFRAALREEVGEVVLSRSEIDAELAYLLEVLSA